jgi:hypothetical protein
MKNRYLAGLFSLFIVSFNSLIAQETVPVRQTIPDKPLIFSQLPDRIDFSFADIEKIFRAEKASAITLHLSAATLSGVITEKVQRSPGSTSYNIKLSNYPGALLTISLINEQGQKQKVRGRIVHPQSGDVLLLVQENEHFYFEKKQQKYFMTE